VVCDNDFTTLSIIMMFYHDTIVYHDSASNDEMQNSTWIILYIVCFLHIMPHQNKSKYIFIIAQWIIHTRRIIMWSTQTTLINKSFNFMIILRFKCLVVYIMIIKKLYHIMIMDLCDRYITLSILLHITIINPPNDTCILICVPQKLLLECLCNKWLLY